MNHVLLPCLSALACLTVFPTSHAVVSDTEFELFSMSEDAACIPDRNQFVDAFTAKGNIIGNWVSVRVGPGEACDLSSSPTNDQLVNILGSLGGFYAISFRSHGTDYRGWVDKQDVKVGQLIRTNTSAETTAMAGSGSATNACAPSSVSESLNERGVVFITSGRLNVRSGPSTNCGILDSLTKDSVVHVIGRSHNNWREITYDSATTGTAIRGWVFGDFIN